MKPQPLTPNQYLPLSHAAWKERCSRESREDPEEVKRMLGDGGLLLPCRVLEATQEEPQVIGFLYAL